MRYRWELSLVGVAAVWGWAFVAVQDAIESVPPFLFLALRFALASALLAAAGAFRNLRREEARAGVAMGVALFAGYALQTVGLQYTTPSNAGLITGLYVVLTPLLGIAALGRFPTAGALSGVALATGGLILLARPEGLGLTRGDALVLGCAAAFAVHFLLTGRLAPGLSAGRLAGVQIATTCVLASAWTAVAERAPVPVEASVWGAILMTGVLATALAFLIQTRAQQQIPPTRTAVILTSESVFAAIFGYLLAGDRLGARGYAGATLILAGILSSELLVPVDEKI